MDSSSNALANLAGRTLRQLGDLARGLGGRRDGEGSTPPPAEPVAAAPTAVAVAPTPSGHTQVVFLPRDPQWAYAFWEISPADRQRAQASGAQQLCLRVEDVTGLPQGAAHPHARQELVVDAHGSEWFLPIPLSGRDYRVELGYRLAGGGWLPLALSAVARVPAAGPTELVDDRFVAFALDGPLEVSSEIPTPAGVAHEQFYRRAMAGEVFSRRVGSELLHERGAGAGDTAGLSDSGAGLWASGRSESGSGLQAPRSFWLVADAELIVYGATEPDASLFIGDERVPLSADGCFRVHVPFRDGEKLYPIRAVAADGVQERSIRLEFARNTPSAQVNTREEAELSWF